MRMGQCREMGDHIGHGPLVTATRPLPILVRERAQEFLQAPHLRLEDAHMLFRCAHGSSPHVIALSEQYQDTPHMSPGVSPRTLRIMGYTPSLCSPGSPFLFARHCV